MRVTMFLISASGEVEEANGIGLMTGGGRRYSNSGGESKDGRFRCLLLEEYRGGGSRGRGRGWDSGDGCNDNGGGKFLFRDVVVWVRYLVPKGFLGGDIKGVGVLELGLGLLDVGVERFFVLLVQDFTGGVGEVVEGDFDKNVTKGRVGRGLEDKVGEGAEVVLEGGGGLGYIVLIDSVEGRGPRDGRRRHWRQGSVSSCY